MEKRVRQLSIFIENRAGRLAEVCALLGEKNINILGFSIADTAGYGIFRIIVEDVDNAKDVLKAGTFTVKESDVLCVDVPHQPGGLGQVLQLLSSESINVEYMYVVANTLIVLNLSDPLKGREVLEKNGIDIKGVSDLIG